MPDALVSIPKNRYSTGASGVSKPNFAPYLELLMHTALVPKTTLRQLSIISQAMLSMTGRVTMLGISRWAGKGGSYRTIQRFYSTIIPWTQVLIRLFKQHLYNAENEYFMVGDESVVTKSGKETHGIDYFFSGLLNKVVKSVAIFSISLVSVEDQHSYPLQVEQVVRTDEEKAAAKAKKKKKKAKKRKKRGRPKGSKNKDKTKVDLTPELLRIQRMIKKQLKILAGIVKIRYIALDGHFGNNNALQITASYL